MAVEILRNNDMNVNKFVFSDNLPKVLSKGRGKNRNLIIIGPYSCGKTFILNPLDTFTNPSNCKYAFVGVEKKELMLQNDLRWTPEMIPWSDFLNLFEGQTVHLAAPKTHFIQEIILPGDIQIFAAIIEMVQLVDRSNHVQGENAMIAARWKEVKFKAPISIEKQTNLESCAGCFPELIFTGVEI